MLNPDQFMDLKLLHQQGHSIRQIAKQTGLSRNTVRKALRAKAPPVFKTPQRSSKLDPFKDYLRQRHTECGLSAVRLLQELEPMGYSGSIDLLRRFLKPLKAPAKALAKATVRFETPPGQQAQADWKYCGQFPDASGKLISIYAFVIVLSFSRLIFVRFTTSMKLPVLIDCHQRAFEFFGGWPAAILYDNMKQVRLSFSQWNPLLLDFASHYGFVAKTHRPYRPRTKGKVERAICYLDDNFLRGRRFADLEDLNAQGLHWCEYTANVRVHATTQQRPVDLWPKENLTAFASAPAYHLAEPLTRKIDAEAMVAFQKSRYSVPPEHVGQTVTVLAEQGRIIIRCGQLILAEHAQAAKPGSSMVAAEHAAALWKLALPRVSTPPPGWHLRFQQEVATRPLNAYEGVAA
jgi:transposase